MGLPRCSKKVALLKYNFVFIILLILNCSCTRNPAGVMRLEPEVDPIWLGGIGRGEYQIKHLGIINNESEPLEILDFKYQNKGRLDIDYLGELPIIVGPGDRLDLCFSIQAAESIQTTEHVLSYAFQIIPILNQVHPKLHPRWECNGEIRLLVASGRTIKTFEDVLPAGTDGEEGRTLALQFSTFYPLQSPRTRVIPPLAEARIDENEDPGCYRLVIDSIQFNPADKPVVFEITLIDDGPEGEEWQDTAFQIYANPDTGLRVYPEFVPIGLCPIGTVEMVDISIIPTQPGLPPPKLINWTSSDPDLSIEELDCCNDTMKYRFFQFIDLPGDGSTTIALEIFSPTLDAAIEREITIVWFGTEE
ncbi:MAG: hypothetical protein PHC78_00350 [Verrucomicrobiota bacterium]|nr:hypothetical protein [Verrucomicrobiota bacterium]